MEIQVTVTADAPGLIQYRLSYYRTLEERSKLLWHMGRTADAEVCLRTLLAAIEESKMKSYAHVRIAATALLILGQLLDELEKESEALAEFDRAKEKLRPWTETGKSIEDARQLLAAVLIQRSVVLHKLNRDPESAKELERSAILAKGANPARSFERFVALVRIGEISRALTETEAFIDPKNPMYLEMPLSPQKWFYAALVFARASEPVRGQPSTAIQQQYAKRAMEMLVRAKRETVFTEYDDVLLLRIDPNLKSLRLRDDFKQLLQEVENELKR